ncbi:MarR family winged helix-turn-helix transcriptional regulator [Paenibacillus xanthanilyticus]|uniref:MarR family winged helix-turn-helix transcriptional regulator n=1 Tax=Paenibacillus xanthanilyticus TaxID=1783531 RepID=A0ABV8K3B7_9BACL
MYTENDADALALIRAFRQLRHINWRGQHAIEGYTPGETMLLFCVRRSQQDNPNGLKPSEISQHMRIATPSVTQMVNLLVARGALARTADPTDRRAVRITLTGEGERVTELAHQAMRRGLEGLLQHLGHDRARQLVDLLEDVFQYYSAQAAAETDAPSCESGAPDPKPSE